METLSPLIQKLADVLQMSIDRLTEMYPTLVQEATWYTIIRNTQQFAGWALFLSFCAAIIVGMVSVPLCDEDNFAQEFRQRITKILKIEAIVIGILTTILAIATIFGHSYIQISTYSHTYSNSPEYSGNTEKRFSL